MPFAVFMPLVLQVRITQLTLNDPLLAESVRRAHFMMNVVRAEPVGHPAFL